MSGKTKAELEQELQELKGRAGGWKDQLEHWRARAEDAEAKLEEHAKVFLDQGSIWQRLAHIVPGWILLAIVAYVCLWVFTQTEAGGALGLNTVLGHFYGAGLLLGTVALIRFSALQRWFSPLYDTVSLLEEKAKTDSTLGAAVIVANALYTGLLVVGIALAASIV